MQVFISWSGNRSRQLAEALRDWLPLVINAVEPWISSVDIAAGSRWNNEVAAQLEASKVGIFCLTAENLKSPWLHFEAGAIAKGAGKTYACTLLLNISPAQVEWPLAQFQAKQAERTQIQELLQTINAAEKPILLREDHLLRAFEKWWPELEEKIKAIPSEGAADIQPPSRSTDSLLNEILALLRTQERKSDERLTSARPPTIFSTMTEKVYSQAANFVRLYLLELGMTSIRVSLGATDVQAEYRAPNGALNRLSIPHVIASSSERLASYLAQVTPIEDDHASSTSSMSDSELAEVVKSLRSGPSKNGKGR